MIGSTGRDQEAGPGRLMAVVGQPGLAAQIAIAAAQTLAHRQRSAHAVVLADLALHARLAPALGIDPARPGLTDLVRDLRLTLGAPLAASATVPVPGRAYRLLVGLRRRSDWSAIGAAALDVVLDDLTLVGTVIALIDADLEGETSTGSLDIEDRNRLARTVAGRADTVVATCTGDAVGHHDATVLLRDLVAHHVDPARIVLLIERDGRSRRSARWSATITAEAATAAVPVATVTVLSRRLPRRPRPVPGRALIRSVAGALAPFDGAAPSRRLRLDPVPARIAPGELGGCDP